MHNNHMVDERFELLALIYRLAGRPEYNDLYHSPTEYAKKLAAAFAHMKDHATVKWAAASPASFDAVPRYAVHLEKIPDIKPTSAFALLPDLGSISGCGRWTPESAAEFLPLVNNFYAESGFDKFFEEHAPFYEEETRRFIETTYGAVDLEWFRSYTDPENLRCIYSPTAGNYGSTVNNKIVYSIVTGDGGAIVHEFCHHFGNPIGDKWFVENPTFNQWCRDTWNEEKYPYYTLETMGPEYVVRAYDSLYQVQHGAPPVIVFAREKAQGFTYIEDVYALITPHEKLNLRDEEDFIRQALGGDYETAPEQTLNFTNEYGTHNLRWNLLTPKQPLPYKYPQTEVGNVFGSQTGQAVLERSDDGAMLLVDLGETAHEGESVRKYARFPITL